MDALARELLWHLWDARLAVALAAVLVGGFMRGFVGFGAALVIVPILSLAYGPRMTVAVSTVMGIPTLFQLLPDAIRHSERRIVLPVGATILLTAPLGTWALVSVHPALMKVAISALVLLMVLMLAQGWKLGQDVKLPILVGAGIASGLAQGTGGVGGPPAVAVALSRAGAPERQRGNVLAMMTAVALSSLLPLLYFGLFTKAAIILGLLLLPAYGGAIWLGSRYFAHGGAQYFRRAALGMLGVIAVATLLVAARDYWVG